MLQFPQSDQVLERMYRQVKIDHENCTFIDSMEKAPNQIECIITSKASKYRFIRASSSVTMMDGNVAVQRWFQGCQRVIFGVYADNGNRLNRYWTQYSYPRQRVAQSDNKNFVLPPRLSKPGLYHNMAQIDIKSAYYSIMNLVGIHPRIVWGVSVGVGDKLEGKYPFTPYKTVRNSLYGTCFAPRLTYVTRGDWKLVIPKNKVLNPHLVQVTQTILHSICRKAIELGAVQWYTDGGILPASNCWDLMLWIAENYGLSSRLKCIGDAFVVRPDQYITPVHKPRRRLGKPDTVNTVDGFNYDYPYGGYETWLQGKLSVWVKRRMQPEVIDEIHDKSWIL